MKNRVAAAFKTNCKQPLARSHSSNGMRNLEEFRIVIRVAEIESISFFDLNYYHDDFVEKPKKFWKLITQQE